MAAKQHLARNTMIPGTLELAESFGVAAGNILSEINLDRVTALRFGALVPSEAIIDAVECAATLTGRDDFGLILGTRQDHRLIGPLGLLFEQCSSLAELQSYSQRFFHLHNTNLVYSLGRERGRGVFRLDIQSKGMFEPRQYVEALFVICVRMARVMLGPRVAPVTVLFAHKRLAELPAYQRHLGADVRFGQKMNAMVCSAADLDRKVEPRNPDLKRRLETMLEELDAQHAGDLAAKVAHLVQALLPADAGSIDHVAKLMGVAPRTLQRRLRTKGVCFSDVLAQTRLKMAREYLGSGFTRTQVAPLLGFSEVSALSRFLRDHQAR